MLISARMLFILGLNHILGPAQLTEQGIKCVHIIPCIPTYL